MTRLAVSIFVRSVPQAISDTARAAEYGADLVEFRADELAHEPEQLIELIERSALPCVLTCRPVWEGGRYEGDEAKREVLFGWLGQATREAAYVDVELAAFQGRVSMQDAVRQIVDHPGQIRPTSTGLILSSHDFEGRPIDLYQRIEAMTAATACRVIKVAWRARSLRDNVEAFEIIMQRPKPAIVLCMGEWGLPSRVLARKFGALLTFAALEEGTGTAPGQPTVTELKRLYRWDALNAETTVFGVIGYPVAHSMSPAIHNAGFEAVGFDGVYLPLPIAPEYESFKATVDAWIQLNELDFHGASVTIPHKQNLLRFVLEFGGEVEPLARKIGAANTLTVRWIDGKPHLSAANTDYAAALDAVCAGMGIERDGLKGKRIAVIGAGGVAKAVVAGFAHEGASVVIYNRTFEKAGALARQFDGVAGKVVPARLEKLCDSCCGVFINCTSVGMHPNVDDTPVPSADDTKGWGPGTIVFDTVYNPVETRLLREARAAGCVTIPGTEMFIRQAAAQFSMWTGKDAPLDTFRTVLTEQLGG